MRFKIITLIILMGLTACTLPAAPTVATATLSATLPPATFTETPLPTETSTPLPTETPIPTNTATPSPVPTYSVLRGEVTADQLACRYGPGWPYLWFDVLLKGNRREVIGRLDDANWIYVQAIGGNKPCWVKAEFMDVQGNIMSVEPIYPQKAKLPVSPYYPPTTVLSTTRDGNTVNVSWLDIPLIAGDEENERMNHYIIEVWRCEAGKIHFEPLATNDLEISFNDEPGCSEPSRGRIFVQEKHGFAGPTDIPWPPYEEQP
ncbi:MAG: hypothetical protein JXB38_10545 [Anaerolineales bacterium]|nr:hypothetical protein [Anaerolineales bacterium]